MVLLAELIPYATCKFYRLLTYFLWVTTNISDLLLECVYIYSVSDNVSMFILRIDWSMDRGVIEEQCELYVVW